MRSCKRYSKRKISALLGAVRQEHAHFRKVERGELDESASFCQSCADLSAVVRQLRRELATRQETVDALNAERKRQGTLIAQLSLNLVDAKRATIWQPISTSPQTWHERLLWDPNLGGMIKGCWKRDGWVDGGGNYLSPTHWMPLPPAPEVTK